MDLTLTEAWAVWWSGQQLTDFTVCGVSVLWSARIGKFLAFLAGCTIVLDIVGSERLVAWGQRVKPRLSPQVRHIGILALMPAGVVNLVTTFTSYELNGLPLQIMAMIAVLMVVGYVMGKWADPLAVMMGRLLAHPRFERWLRIIAVPLFFVGFALDYLAS